MTVAVAAWPVLASKPLDQPGGKPMRAVSPLREKTPTYVDIIGPPAPSDSTLAWTSSVALRRLRPTTQLPEVKRRARSGTATHASSGRPRRRTAKKATGPTTTTYTARKPTSHPISGVRRPASAASEWASDMSPPNWADVAPRPDGSTSPDHRPAATAPSVTTTSPRPAGARPRAPGCHASGSPGTVWPLAASTSSRPPSSIHRSTPARAAGERRPISSTSAMSVDRGPRLAGACSRSAGARAAKRALPASTARGDRPGTGRPRRAPGRMPTSSVSAAARMVASPDATSWSPWRRRATTSGFGSKPDWAVSRNSFWPPPGTSTAIATGTPFSALPMPTSSVPRTSRSADTRTRTGTSSPGTNDVA
jgi:hypothetical protein